MAVRILDTAANLPADLFDEAAEEDLETNWLPLSCCVYSEYAFDLDPLFWEESAQQADGLDPDTVITPSQ